MLPTMAAKGGKPSFTIPAVALIEDEIARTAAKRGRTIIAQGEGEYLKALAAIEEAPPLDKK